ncbi:MAG TPA: DUF4230 domain-containing protein [Bryobacteraceae bacterium]|nr:DUF4230 domain-containing protein [Bryobacteraceae bacterium]
MKWKIAAVVSMAAFFLLLLVTLGSAALRRAFGIREFNSESVVTQVQRLNHLATVKYSIQRVVGMREPKVPVGEESILLMVQGEALAGVDLSKLRANDIVYSGKQSILIVLPQAKLLNVYLDEKQTKVWDRQITWWTPWIPYDPDLEHKARMQALDEVRGAALQLGILDQAQTNAESSIRDLLSALQISATFKKRPLD